METRESNFEQQPVNLDQLYGDSKNLKEREFIDSLREVIEQFLNQDPIDKKALSAAIKSRKIPIGCFPGDKKQQFIDLLKAEILEKIKQKQEVPAQPEKSLKVGDIIEMGDKQFKVKGFTEKVVHPGRAIVTEPLNASKSEGPQKQKEVTEPKKASHEEELNEEKKELLEEINERGRLVMHANVGSEFGSERNVGRGFQTFIDGKKKNKATDEALKLLMSHGRVHELLSDTTFGVHSINRDFLKEKNINVIATIAPLKEKIPIFEDVEVEKKEGWLFKTKKIEIVKEFVRTEEKSIPMGKFNGNSADTEEAYRIFITMCGTEQNPYYDDVGRTGSASTFNVIVPKSIAHEAFRKIQEHPEFIFEILTTLDSEMMEDQQKSPHGGTRSRMPRIKDMRMVIVPQEKIKEAFIAEGGIAKDINPKYIKEPQ